MIDISNANAKTSGVNNTKYYVLRLHKPSLLGLIHFDVPFKTHKNLPVKWEKISGKRYILAIYIVPYPRKIVELTNQQKQIFSIHSHRISGDPNVSFPLKVL